MRMPRNPNTLLAVLLLGIMLVVVGCGDKEPSGVGPGPVSKIEPAGDPVVDAPQVIEQAAAKAQTEINKTNASSTLDSLRKEVAGDKE